jgi:hypothetical protein
MSKESNVIEVQFNGKTHKLRAGGVVVKTCQESDGGEFNYWRYTIRRNDRDDVTIEYTTAVAEGCGLPARTTHKGVWNRTNYGWDWINTP